MMGLGYFGSSSSSSSSNLSPLAPPFTVGRSNHNKPVVQSNPVSHLNDPPYAVPFTSSWPYSHSSTARQEVLADIPRRTSNDDYGYIIPDPNNSTTNRNWSGLNSNGLEQNTLARSYWSAVNPNPKRVPDTFSYNLTDAKPFYPPHAIASSLKSNDIPLVSLSEASCDLLSTSGLVHEDETSQVDYTRSLSGLEYNPKQEGVWSRLPLPDGKPMEAGDSFFSEEANIAAASLAYGNYLNQESAFGMETLNKGKDDPTMLYYADIMRRPDNNGPLINGKSDGTSIFANDPNELSKGETNVKELAMFSESHPLIQSPEDYPWNSQKSSPYEKRYHMFDCISTSSSTTKSSPLVIKPPAAVSAQTTASSSSSCCVSLEIGNLNISDVVVASSHNKSLKERELHQGLESNGTFVLAPNQLSFQMGRTNEQHTFVACPSSTKEDDMQLNFDFKARPSFQVPDINIPNAEALDSAFDHHNPAEDSPCWKGAPSPHFEAHPPPTKKLQTAGNAQASTQIDHCSINHHSSDEKASGPTTTPIFFPFEKEHTDEVVDVGFTSFKVSSGGAQSTHDDATKPNKGHKHSSTSSNANSQTPKLPDLPNPQEDAIITFPDAKKVNTASILVKALFDLSDLLLHDSMSNDEFALKEHHYETLGHVIHNLRVCMSRQVQVVPTHKLMFPQQNTSDGSQQAHKKPKSGASDKNVVKLLEHASLRDTPSKDDNLVQAIKKALAENLECEVELPSETLLYKNLWLEAEAELCSLSYRARFERLKKETQNIKSTARDASAAAIKGISSCNGSSDVKADSSEVSNVYSVDDVEASVMERFNILKRRGDQNFGRNIEEEVAHLKVTGSKVDLRHQLCKDDDDVVVGSGKVDVEPWVMARLNILNCRGESNAAIEIQEEKHVRVRGKVRESAFQDEAAEEEDDAAGATGGSGSDWEHIPEDGFSWRLS